MANKKIMYASDEAAKHVTISGWMSADGIFWPDKNEPAFAEHHARWGGCTHKVCDCGNEYEKHYTMCHICRNEESNKRYDALTFQEWKGEPLCLWHDDRYFFGGQDLLEYAEEHEIEDISKIQLVICEPRCAGELDADSYYCDLLPEDMSLSDVAPKLAAAIADVNAIIEKKEEILCWMPSNIRTTIQTKDLKKSEDKNEN